MATESRLEAAKALATNETSEWGRRPSLQLKSEKKAHCGGSRSVTRRMPYRPRMFANTRRKRPGAARRSSCAVEAGTIGGAGCTGIVGVSLSRPCLVKTKRRSTSRQDEHMKLWCSKPRIAIACSWTTFIRIISAPHVVQGVGDLLIYQAISCRAHCPRLSLMCIKNV